MIEFGQEPTAEEVMRQDIEADRRAAAGPTAPAFDRRALGPAASMRATDCAARLLLRWPVEGPLGLIDAIDIQPPTFADVEAVTAGEIAEVDLHARMCGLPTETLKRLRWSDFEIVAVVARHLAPQIVEAR